MCSCQLCAGGYQSELWQAVCLSFGRSLGPQLVEVSVVCLFVRSSMEDHGVFHVFADLFLPDHRCDLPSQV